MAKWSIPEPLAIDWTMREASSAGFRARELEDGRKQFTLDHAPLPGVKPEMMVWFLKNLDRVDLEWRDYKGVLAYRYWHPRDHVYFRILGAPGAGCRFQIVEAFQANPKYLSERIFDVPKLDHTGFRIELRVLGSLITTSEEDFVEIPEGMRYKVTMTLGSNNTLVKRLASSRLRRFMAGEFQAWRRHNVEEVGNLVHFLPELYAKYAK